eukprot:m51a1_g12077 hypothetical protein (177) ;mRNA; r:1264-2112
MADVERKRAASLRTEDMHQADGSSANRTQKKTSDELFEVASQELKREFDTRVDFDDLDTVFDIVRADNEQVVIVALGVPWSHPCRIHFANMQMAVTEGSGARLFNVNHENFRTFCPDVVVGTPATLVYFQGQALPFKRSGWTPLKYIVGALGQKHAVELISRVKGRTAGADIELPF